ncbi:uncharacterized protein L3040_005455 [Drepanopeziza brunnea f. sp. 'multigermtubi']|uniref:HECT-type E3 ubiquitin transferase n=1 Tax=Marssonina brunnea f. sp. multigermtubi (strain MB_m1) TaxID=1072389 RepID=K1WZ66_MARBU|nr:HECT-domain-containing protein [Drepanopeziza brunnea f. sp. 'multigermtubi' MB_m1]EKD13933.1 HECT-domain-containing protein [Drepanopeziza brunnea f. sp. 'multigermtubi' MB_m1]KAJ5040896.1 hypothetical protein L3040_005455 [Drepanopeziza brunnea f. sp. 'multigermtubi']
MTRETRQVHDERDRGQDQDAASEAEIYAALWATAPFPRLPDDAPHEVKRLTIDVEEPKRIYGIHKARRRHNFQLLVERYILQIRYGCQSETCTTTTCFSCRKRAANGVPIRRYNSSSARTLAIYMASQDNPEQGLCHHTSVGRAAPVIQKPLKSRPIPPTEDRISPAVPATPRRNDGRQTPKNGAFVEDLPGVDKQTRKKLSAENLIRRTQVDLAALEEPSTIDPRSFVQNVFGTVAYKMVEWLTPRNLDLLARSQHPDVIPNEIHPTPQHQHDGGPSDPPIQGEPINAEVPELASDVAEDSIQVGKPSSTVSIPESTVVTKPEPVDSQETKPGLHQEPNTHTVAGNVPLSNRTKKSNSRELQTPKGILSKSQKLTDATDPLSPPASNIVQPRKPIRRMSHQALITSPRIRSSSVVQTNARDTVQHDGTSDEASYMISPYHEVEQVPVDRVSRPVEAAKPRDHEKSNGLIAHKQPWNPAKTILRERKGRRSTLTDEVLLPQSMSSLSIETIDLLCDIMQTDGTCEKHLLQPRAIDDTLKRFRTDSTPLSRNPSPRLPSHSSRTRNQWKVFIEQSFFDVLGKPDSLLRSFSDDGTKLFDSQTTWYLLLRMTRATPSLVFDSLWNVAGVLFRPPEKLELAYEWAKHSKIPSPGPLSNDDAARLLNICLHALVAAVPLISDARRLANMSRMRSYGLAVLGREPSSLEPMELCLQYEDAFTDEPAFRLARRVFASIPTRRSFAELLELEKDVRNDEIREPDILDSLLGTLRFLDPVLDFSDEERDMHEKRIPTLILDWARTVVLQEWDGSGIVPNNGPLGGALAMMAAIYENRKSLLLGDIHFRTEYFADRLDPVDMPLEWLSFVQNKRTVHLLDYPYLFNPSTLVTYFRAINYSKMNNSYERAHTTGTLVAHFVNEGGLVGDRYRKEKLNERLRTATSEYMVLEIRRSHVLLDSFNALWRREERELMRPLKIRLGEEGGEEGLDSGGVQQEFFRLAIAEALDPDYGTFTIDSRTKMTWFQPGSPEPLWKFELIGMVVSLAVYNGLTLPVTFPKALYRKLLDEEVTELHHIADGWPELANGLTTLLEWDEKDGLVEDIFARTYEFSIQQFGQSISREMGTASTHWPQFADLQTSSNPTDAPSVTNQNRNSFVSDYIRWLTDISIQPQFDAFKAGFYACLDRRAITLFSPETLQSVVEGVQEIDISEMRRAARYVGWEGDASHRSVRDFWSIVKRYDLSQKRKLLEFVTASDRVPVGGMRNLQFTLQRNGVDDGHLPSSYTCYGILLLPEYSSKEVLREKLAMALENSKGFGFA